MKFISSIVAFSLTFILSVVLIGVPQNTFFTTTSHTNCFNHNENNVVQLLRQDVRNGDVRRYEINEIFKVAENTTDFSVELYAEYVQEYVDKSQSMDDYDLPADFQNAWRKHMKAWRDYSDFLNKLKKSSELPSYSEFIEMDRNYSMEINRTWYNTLRIGKRYDANLNYKIY
jgi:hypothetical protein